MRTTRLCGIVLFLALTALNIFAQEITVAAAADLQSAMQDIATRFEKETGKKVRVVYGSSGNFFQQIQNGAPFDVFFSANLNYAKKLESAGLAEAGTLFQYATGKIVLWVPAGSKVDVSVGLKALTDPAIRKVSIANPEHAPYGQAAVAALQKENLYEQVKSKLVMGENISQAASFVLSGSADAGVIALSLALAPNMKDKGRYVEVPASDYPPIEQACVLLKSSQKKDAARAFLDYVKTPASAEMLRSYGFGVK
jgi:molybdate transport system substrate-binding protein